METSYSTETSNIRFDIAMAKNFSSEELEASWSIEGWFPENCEWVPYTRDVDGVLNFEPPKTLKGFRAGPTVLYLSLREAIAVMWNFEHKYTNASFRLVESPHKIYR